MAVVDHAISSPLEVGGGWGRCSRQHGIIATADPPACAAAGSPPGAWRLGFACSCPVRGWHGMATSAISGRHDHARVASIPSSIRVTCRFVSHEHRSASTPLSFPQLDRPHRRPGWTHRSGGGVDVWHVVQHRFARKASGPCRTCQSGDFCCVLTPPSLLLSVHTASSCGGGPVKFHQRR